MTWPSFFANILSGISGECVHMVLLRNPLEYKICEKCYRLHPETMLFFNSPIQQSYALDCKFLFFVLTIHNRFTLCFFFNSMGTFQKKNYLLCSLVLIMERGGVPCFEPCWNHLTTFRPLCNRSPSRANLSGVVWVIHIFSRAGVYWL